MSRTNYFPGAPTESCDDAGCGCGSGPCPPGSDCDYLPYCVNVDPAGLDATILALTPWSYYKCNDASGNPQDSSGNARHATSTNGSVSYSQTALSTKAGNSIRLNGGGFVIPQPGDVSLGTTAWSAAMLVNFTDFDKATTANGWPNIIGATGANPPKFMFTSQVGGSLPGNPTLYFDSNFTDSQGRQSRSPFTMVLGITYALVLIGTVDGGGTGSCHLYVDGVLWASTLRVGNGLDGTVFAIGNGGGGFWSTNDFNVSNIAFWNSTLTYANVITLTEVMADATVLANGLVIAS